MDDNCFTEFCCFLSYLNMVSKIHQKVSIRCPLVTYQWQVSFPPGVQDLLNIFCICVDFPASYTVVFFVTKLEVPVVRFLCAESAKIPHSDKEHIWRSVLTSEIMQMTRTVYFPGLFMVQASSPQHFWYQRLILWRTDFVEDSFFTSWAESISDNSSALHLLCTLSLLLLHQLHLSSSGIRSQRLGTPILGYQWLLYNHERKFIIFDGQLV